MFNFLKEKLKSALSKFSRDVDKESDVVEKKVVEKAKKAAKAPKKEKAKKRIEKPAKKEKKREVGIGKKPKIKEVKEEKKEIAEEKAEKGFFGRLKERFAKKEEEVETEEEKEEIKEAEEKPEKEKKGFFEKVREVVTTKTLSDEKFEKIFWDLEVALLENNVAVEVIEKIKGDLKKKLVQQRFDRGEIDSIIGKTLYDSISSLFNAEKISIIEKAKKKKPYIVVFVGVNGSGKTTSIAKIAHIIQKNKMKPVIAAADTFRAAAIQQLEEHANKLGVRLIKHDYGSDPAAVAFDAIKYAESKGADVVLIDTAGRQHSNVNLMDEMKKIVRVAKPDLKIFIGESITGNDCIEQAKSFNDAIGIDAIILTKADIDEKGGAAVSVSYVTGKPIIYIGMGQGYDDMKEFDKKLIMENIGLA